MRKHEDIGYDSFNSYRSGDESSRRNDYGGWSGNPRGGSSIYGRSSRDNDSSDRNYSTEPGYYGSGTSNINSPQNQQRNPYDSNRYSQIRSQNRGGNWMTQDRSGNQQNFQPNESYSNRVGRRSWSERDENWEDRPLNRLERYSDRTGHQVEDWADRAGDRLDRWGNRISNAWDRWTGDEDRNRNDWPRNPEHRNNFSHGNAMQNRYSADYDNPMQGNRVQFSGRRNEDEGFFDHLGNRISNVWDRLTGEDDDDEERRYQNRNRFSSYDNRSNPYGPSNRNQSEW